MSENDLSYWVQKEKVRLKKFIPIWTADYPDSFSALCKVKTFNVLYIRALWVNVNKNSLSISQMNSQENKAWKKIFLTLNALKSSIFTPYGKGFTWINLNKNDLPQKKKGKRLTWKSSKYFKFSCPVHSTAKKKFFRKKKPDIRNPKIGFHNL